MSFDPPAGILDIGNATLRVGKLEVAETTGLSQGLQNVIKNDLLITENETYSSDQKWGVKLPNNWVSEFELKGVSGKYLEFNFYNEGSSSNTLGYTLNFKDTTLSLRYDNGSWTTATIPTIVDTYRKINVFFERNVISVTMDGTQVLYYKHTGTPPPVMSRVTSATGGAFINLFVESTAGNPEFKNLRIVNGRFISDQTSNIAFMGGNLGVGVNSPQEALDIRGNMHLTRVSNVSQVSVDSNVVTEYTGPHGRPLRKYPEVVLTADDNLSTLGYKASVSSQLTGNDAFRAFDATGATTYWHSQYPYYTHVTGTYNPGQSSGGTGTPSGTLPTTELISGHQGEWIKLQMPKKIKLEEVRVYASNRAAAGTNVYQMPKDIAIAGSNDGTNWYLVDSGTLRGTIRESYGMASLPVTTSSYYSHLALIVKTTDNQGANYSAVEIANIEYYGREEGSGSLDTTLKTVYNVPATTGTQLEVYYDGQDYTGLTSTVTDKVGNSNSTISSGSDITFDSTWKAWDFSNSTTRTQSFRSGTLPTSLTSISYISAALWFKLGTTTGDRTLFFISDPEANRTANEFLELRINANQDYRFSLWDGEYTWRFQPPFFADESYDVPTGEWYHIVLSVKDASSTGRKLYFNGVECDLTDAGSRLGVASSTELNLPSDAILELGRRPGDGVGNTVHDASNEFDGSIANFRLYGKALDAGQAKELYDYQKDYFLGSKSQVTLYKGHLGVGVTEPSGQLELAGDERIQEYPPGPMNDFGTNIPGHGMFKVYASSWLDNGSFKVWGVFDKSRDSVGWHDTDTPYTNGTHTGSRSLGGIKGEWIALELPYAVNLKSAATVPRTGYEMRGPGEGVILGSNDGSNWDQLHSFSGLTSTNEIPTYVGNITAPGYYTIFALVVTKLTGAPSSTNTNSLNLSEIKFFGTPGPTTLDKGSLSLTRNLDVPRLSRYDVDTETPRPEKLLVDYDTDVHPFNFTSLKDKSGRGNNAFAVANGIYSAPDKAFKFDGVNDGLYAEHPTGNSWGNAGIGFPTGDARYTMSCWIRADLNQPSSNPAIMYVGSSWATYKLAGIYLRNGNKLAADIGSSSVYTTNQVINAGQWYHVAIVKRGQGALSTSQSYMGLFVDGVEITAKTQDNNYTQSLDTVDFLSIGCDFNGSMSSFGSGFKGCISKPQIWSVALEPSEIMKIYKLGRVGRSTVLADTNLQIGAGQHSSVTSPPYATLDVHGHALISGELQCMEGNFHKMLGFARGGGHADHQRTDNCIVAMAGTTVVSSGHAYVSFAIRKSPNWMPYFLEVYHAGVNHGSENPFSRVSHAHGRIYGTSVNEFSSATNVSSSASDMGGDMVRFRIFVNREGRYYGVTMVKLAYYYGIRGRMD